MVTFDDVVSFFVKYKNLEEDRINELWNLGSVNPGGQKQLPFIAFSKFVQQAESVTYRELISPADPLILISEEIEKSVPKPQDVCTKRLSNVLMFLRFLVLLCLHSGGQPSVIILPFIGCSEKLGRRVYCVLGHVRAHCDRQMY